MIQEYVQTVEKTRKWINDNIVGKTVQYRHGKLVREAMAIHNSQHVDSLTVANPKTGAEYTVRWKHIIGAK